MTNLFFYQRLSGAFISPANSHLGDWELLVPGVGGPIIDLRTEVWRWGSGEMCRTAAGRMADAGVGRLPVVTREDPARLAGIVTRSDLLKARERYLELEQRRERRLRPPWRQDEKTAVQDS